MNRSDRAEGLPKPPRDEPAVAVDEPAGSVTQWIGDLKAGDLQALLPLWDRYYSMLVERARAKLGDLRGPRAVHDEEDLALREGNRDAVSFSSESSTLTKRPNALQCLPAKQNALARNPDAQEFGRHSPPESRKGNSRANGTNHCKKVAQGTFRHSPYDSQLRRESEAAGN